MLGPTRCRGWTVCDLSYHLLLDAQRSLVALGTPTAAEPDRDYRSYWRGWEASVADAQLVRAAAAGFADPRDPARIWGQTSAAVLRLAQAADPGLRLATQGHVLGLPDLLATLAVEITVHHLDLLPGRATEGPGPGPLGLLERTLDGLLGGSRPPGWDVVSYALKATGREPLGPEDRAALGKLAERLPLFT